MRKLAFAGLLSLLFVLPVRAVTIGPKAPDGTEPAIDLPMKLRKANIRSLGLGCCVFRSIEFSAHWQNLPQFYGFPEWLVANRIPGGGWPQKVDKLIPRICADRNLPVPKYIQVQTKDLEILRLAIRTGRMPAITYTQSHMVSLVHADAKWFGILDNNRINTIEWRNEREFNQIYTGWAVIFLAPGPPPIPLNSSPDKVIPSPSPQPCPGPEP